MARIVGTYKILPEEPEIKPAVIKERIIKALPEDMKVTASGERPIAFGLVALVVDINFAEQDGLQDHLEEILEKIEGVSEIEALQLFRL
ncbi:MAG: elongation factor 1-beta [Candidatus Heimdallarchaeota archaeon]|nr:elongation factor 1-beta [Candidatus Heimdallarchaeota archaeon]MCG3252617.1 elongation factor 1-beta [Candidatus Heimdallarchaeota archaeon]MCK4289755.1 elongation factor 1-beta [Candidatus Heimdallarchaeota archaeon]